METATCIGCGCTDHAACQGEEGPCWWLDVDYRIGRGVCSCCSEHLPRWRAGERERRLLVARIVREGEIEPLFLEAGDLASFSLHLDVAVGDRFSVEWLAMSPAEFEALPQFDHARLAGQWLAECQAAYRAQESGEPAQARKHSAKAARFAAAVAGASDDIPLSPTRD